MKEQKKKKRAPEDRDPGELERSNGVITTATAVPPLISRAGDKDHTRLGGL
jgi:hypothetical protein